MVRTVEVGGKAFGRLLHHWLISGHARVWLLNARTERGIRVEVWISEAAALGRQVALRITGCIVVYRRRRLRHIQAMMASPAR